MKQKKNFEDLVERTMKNYDVGLSKNIKACALYAIDMEIGAKEFAQIGSLFGISKGELADKIVKAIHSDGVLPGQMKF